VSLPVPASSSSVPVPVPVPVLVSVLVSVSVSVSVAVVDFVSDPVLVFEPDEVPVPPSSPVVTLEPPQAETTTPSDKTRIPLTFFIF
jgi:hypothetical protein